MTKVIYHEPEPGLFLVKVIVDDPRHPDDIRLAPKTRIHLVGTANARRVALCTVNDSAHYPTEGWRIELNDARAPTACPWPITSGGSSRRSKRPRWSMPCRIP